MSARKGILLVLVLIVLAIGASIVGSLLLIAGGGAPPAIPSESTLYLPIKAPFDEIEPLSLFGQLREATTLRGMIETVRKAKVDSRVKTLVITPEANGALWGQVQEIRAALVDFRKSGKPITAYIEYGGPQEYYLASAADRVTMMPAGALDLSGLATYELFFRGALDKIGVYPDLLHIGEYKTYSNTFREKGFTPAHREMTRSLNHDFYDQLVKAIAEGRKRSESDVLAAIDGGPYLPEAAQRAGLIDSVGYEDQLDDTAPIKGTRRLEANTYRSVPPSSLGLGQGPRIALLYATGTIASGPSSFDSPGGTVLGSETFVQWLRKVRVDHDINAVVVRIDSPGGSAIASEVIWRELMLTKSVKPLVVSMGDVAASGGYYIALPADAIVAQPGTITGSIGVVTGKFVLEGTLQKLGIAEDSVSEGKFAEINSPFRPYSPAERARVEDQMRTIYDLFVSRVAEARKTTPQKIDQVAQGRVWTGRQARGLNLVDELGGLDTAIRIAKQRARLDLSKDVQLVVYPAKRTLYDLLSNPLGNAMETVLDRVTDRPDTRLLNRVAASLRLFRRAEPLTIMPNVYWR